MKVSHQTSVPDCIYKINLMTKVWLISLGGDKTSTWPIISQSQRSHNGLGISKLDSLSGKFVLTRHTLHRFLHQNCRYFANPRFIVFAIVVSIRISPFARKICHFTIRYLIMLSQLWFCMVLVRNHFKYMHLIPVLLRRQAFKWASTFDVFPTVCFFFISLNHFIHNLC